MLNLGKGYKIYEPEKLSETYEVSNEVSIMANVGVEAGGKDNITAIVLEINR